jgi:phage terminase large subunit
LTDILKSKGYNIFPVNNGQQAKDSDRYNNAISEQWFELKEKINEISLPDIQDLKTELMMREWKLDNKGRRIIESKEEYKKKGFRSPDFADALLLCFYNPKPKVFEVQPVFGLRR